MDELNNENICRICLKTQDTLFSLFRKRKGWSPYEKLLNKANLNIEINDAGPSSICAQCLIELDTTVDFLEKCERSNEWLASKLALSLNSGSKPALDEEVKSLEDPFNISLCPEDVKDEGNNINKDAIVLGVECCPECRSARRCAHWAPPLTHTCQYCSKVFTRKFNYKLHIKRHLGEREWSRGS